MAKTKSTVIVAEQAIAEMNPALRKVYDGLATKLSDMDKKSVMVRYEIGEKVDMIMSNDVKFGEGAADKLAAAFGINVSEVHRFRKFSTTWSRTELAKMLKRPMGETQRAISYNHLRVLSTVTQSRLRTQLTERVFKECLSIRDLQAIVTEKLGTRGNNPAGRKAAVPKTPSAGLSKLHTMTSSLLNSADAIESSVFDVLSTEADKYATDKLLDELEGAQEEQEQLIAAATQTLNKLKATSSQLRRVIVKNAGAKPTTKKTKKAKAAASDEAPVGKKPLARKKLSKAEREARVARANKIAAKDQPRKKKSSAGDVIANGKKRKVRRKTVAV